MTAFVLTYHLDGDDPSIAGVFSSKTLAMEAWGRFMDDLRAEREAGSSIDVIASIIGFELDAPDKPVTHLRWNETVVWA